METFQPPECLRGVIGDQEWGSCVGRIVRFDTLPLARRLDFAHGFAKKHDWTVVGFGSLLETTELEDVADVVRRAVLRRIERARALLDSGEGDKAHDALLEVMRASPIGSTADASETVFGMGGNARRPMTLLGDIIAWQWAREGPGMEHARLCGVAQELLDEGLPPVMAARVILEGAHPPSCTTRTLSPRV